MRTHKLKQRQVRQSIGTVANIGEQSEDVGSNETSQEKNIRKERQYDLLTNPSDGLCPSDGKKDVYSMLIMRDMRDESGTGLT